MCFGFCVFLLFGPIDWAADVLRCLVVLVQAAGVVKFHVYVLLLNCVTCCFFQLPVCLLGMLGLVVFNWFGPAGVSFCAAPSGGTMGSGKRWGISLVVSDELKCRFRVLHHLAGVLTTRD